MKRSVWMALVAALSTAPVATAATIPYPNTGTVAPTVPVFATTSGGVHVYFAGSSASYNDAVEIGDVQTGYNSGAILPNHGSGVGEELTVGTRAGQINAGDQLVFYIVSPQDPSGGFSTARYASLPDDSADGVNHAYITNYDGTGLGAKIPAGIFVGMEDEPIHFSDFNYNDDTFVFTGVSAPSVSATPEPGSLLLFGTGLASLAGMARRRMRVNGN